MNNREVSNPKRVQGTNDNSILSKCSMIKYGYFDDEFLSCMIERFSRRAPLINRGYYIRAKAMEHVVMKFIDDNNGRNIQIISLGAGFDTSFFRLTKKGQLEKCKFFEVDYFTVALKKAGLINQNPKLWNCFRNASSLSVQNDNYIVIDAENYKLIGIDLTKLDMLDACFRASGVNYDLPTLFLSECVITYMSVKKSKLLLRFLCKSFPDNSFVLYEQICPDDSFGRFMCQHFQQLGSSLRGISTFKTKSDQICRFMDCGWEQVVICDMSEFYHDVIDSSERIRVEHLEVFDEYEEWFLKCTHYVVLVAIKGNIGCQSIIGYLPSSSATVLGSQRSSVVKHSMIDDGSLVPASTKSMQLQVRPYTESNECVMRRGGVKAHYCKVGLIHSIANGNSNEYLIRVSGYGQNPFSSGHCRLSSVSILDLRTNLMVHVEPESRPDLLLNSLCGSFNQLSDNSFILFGGRSSPLKPNNCTTMLRLERYPLDGQWHVHCEELILAEGSVVPSERWRHGSVIYWLHDQPHLFIYGGRSSSPSPLSDLFILDINQCLWTAVVSTPDDPSPGPLCNPAVVNRCSSSSKCSNLDPVHCCGCCCVLMFGGLLGDDLVPTNQLWRWCGRQRKWATIQIISGEIQLLPRFSHTAHIVSGGVCGAQCVSFVSLGGVSHRSPSCSSAFITVDMSTNNATAKSVSIDMITTSEECVMLHNHGSAFSEGKRLWIIGGGGNCFSFGTQLNENVYYVDIDID